MTKTKNYLIFSLNPITRVFNVVAGKKERDQVIEHYKETYPNTPIFWAEVQEG